MITISLDVYEKNRKLASFCGSNMDNIFISDKADILEKIRKCSLIAGVSIQVKVDIVYGKADFIDLLEQL